MMSKKKKDKTDEPTKTKTKRSAIMGSHKGVSVIDGAPALAMIARYRPSEAQAAGRRPPLQLGFPTTMLPYAPTTLRTPSQARPAGR
jgi:hypothetical protein